MCIPQNAEIMFLGLKSFFDLIMNNMLFFPPWKIVLKLQF